MKEYTVNIEVGIKVKADNMNDAKYMALDKISGVDYKHVSWIEWE